MVKYFTVEKEINGVNYKAQFNGMSAALEAMDSSYIDGTSNTSMVKLAKYLFDNVIVEPRVTINDFGADKIGETKEKVVNGKKYVAKFGGLDVALKAADNNYVDGTGNTSMVKFSKYLFENVIVTPENLTIDDFDSMEDFSEVVSFAREVMQGGDAMTEFNEVVSFAREVMQGNFRPSENQSTTKKTSKK